MCVCVVMEQYATSEGLLLWQVLAVNEEGLQRCHEATVARGHPVTSVSFSSFLTYFQFVV